MRQIYRNWNKLKFHQNYFAYPQYNIQYSKTRNSLDVIEIVS